LIEVGRMMEHDCGRTSDKTLNLKIGQKYLEVLLENMFKKHE
jgi:hypothetical protein